MRAACSTRKLQAALTAQQFSIDRVSALLIDSSWFKSRVEKKVELVIPTLFFFTLSCANHALINELS
jgi:hypothetical protein